MPSSLLIVSCDEHGVSVEVVMRSRCHRKIFLLFWRGVFLTGCVVGFLICMETFGGAKPLVGGDKCLSALFAGFGAISFERAVLEICFSAGIGTVVVAGCQFFVRNLREYIDETFSAVGAPQVPLVVFDPAAVRAESAVRVWRVICFPAFSTGFREYLRVVVPVFCSQMFHTFFDFFLNLFSVFSTCRAVFLCRICGRVVDAAGFAAFFFCHRVVLSFSDGIL